MLMYLKFTFEILFIWDECSIWPFLGCRCQIINFWQYEVSFFSIKSQFCVCAYTLQLYVFFVVWISGFDDLQKPQKCSQSNYNFHIMFVFKFYFVNKVIITNDSVCSQTDYLKAHLIYWLLLFFPLKDKTCLICYAVRGDCTWLARH